MMSEGEVLMARIRRLYIKNIPQHIVQRGNNQLPSFFGSEDYEQYLDYLNDALERHEVLLHAYCLMPNHVHLLMTPVTSDGISRVMQDLGRRYVRFINYKYGRTGTLWEGRYHSCLVESESYLLDCYRYIELNPMRSGIVKEVHQYKWSSYPYNALAVPDINIVPHNEYLKLGAKKYRRCLAYKRLVRLNIENDLLRKIRDATQSNRVLGTGNFTYWLEKELSITLRKKKAGRPKMARMI
jgi:REP-associated tyrosine transposase